MYLASMVGTSFYFHAQFLACMEYGKYIVLLNWIALSCMFIYLCLQCMSGTWRCPDHLHRRWSRVATLSFSIIDDWDSIIYSVSTWVSKSHYQCNEIYYPQGSWYDIYVSLLWAICHPFTVAPNQWKQAYSLSI